MDEKLHNLLNDPNSPIGSVYKGNYRTTDDFVEARHAFASRLVSRLTPLGINVDVADRTCVVQWPMPMGSGSTNFSLISAKTFDGLYSNILIELEARTRDVRMMYATGTLVNPEELASKLNEAMNTLGWRSSSINHLAVTATTGGNRTLTVAIPSHKDADHVVAHLTELSLLEGDGHRSAPPTLSVPAERIDPRYPYTIHDQAYTHDRFRTEIKTFMERMQARKRMGIIQSFTVNPQMVEVIQTNGAPLRFPTFNYESFGNMLKDIDRHFNDDYRPGESHSE